MYRLNYSQTVPITGSRAWDFFSDPANLAVITPPEMGFEITNGPVEKMYPGMIITYKVRPLLGIATTWVTEISHVNGQEYFVDEQRIGPYKLWHHQHHFKEVDGGTEITDIVDYALPFGFLGRLMHSLIVKRKLAGIFRYRNEKIKELFG